MRTIHLVGPLSARVGGPPEAIAGVISALSARGNSVLAIAVDRGADPAPAADRITASGARLTRLIGSKLSARWQFSARMIPILLREARSSDMLVCHGFYTFSLLAAVSLQRWHRLPVVVMPHGSLEPYEHGRHRLRKFLFRKAVRNGRRLAAVLVATDAEQQNLREHSWLESPIRVVGLGVESPPPGIERASNSDQRAGIRLIALGRVAAKKRLDLCIEVVRLLNASGHPTTLEIVGVGDAELTAALAAQVATAGLQPHVQFVGELTGLEKWQRLCDADVFVLPSENENFAVAVAEALSVGTPVAVTRHVALSYLVSKHAAGVVIPEPDANLLSAAVVEIAGNRTSFSGAAKEAAHALDWAQVGASWETALLDFLSGTEVAHRDMQPWTK